MSFIPNTNYFITNSQGQLVDISTLFNPGTCPTATDYFFLNTTLTVPVSVDLNTVINAITSEVPLANTGFKVTVGGVLKDISEIFQPKITPSTFYTISPSVYPTKEVQSGGYYYIGFQYYSTPATITFHQNISTIYVVVVGGGGCGRDWSNFGNPGGGSTIRSGGGGAGGGVAHAIFSAAPGDSFTVSVGLGGIPQPDGSATPAFPSSFTSVSNPANNITCTAGGTGINDGSGYAIGGIGTISGSLFISLTSGTGGGDGGESLSSSGITSINNGGDSALTSLLLPSGQPFPHGLGGGGGAGNFGVGTFGGTAGNGFGGICGAAPSFQGTTPTGFGCGGGGSASQGGDSRDTIGNDGLVLIYFTFPSVTSLLSYVNDTNQNTRLSAANGTPVSPQPVAKWNFSPPSSLFSFNENQIVIGETGILYAAENNGKLLAIIDNGASASLLWSVDTGFISLVSPTIGNGNLLYGVGTNTMKAVANINTASPTVIWTANLNPLTTPLPPLIHYDIGGFPTIYVSGNGRIYSVALDGSVNWSYTTLGVTYIAVSLDGTCIYATTNDLVYALTTAGVLKWSLIVAAVSGYPTIGADGTIYFVSNNTLVYAVTDNGSSGTLKWNLNTGVVGVLVNALAIGSNGAIYAVNFTTIAANSIIFAIVDNGASGAIKWSNNNLPAAPTNLTAITLGSDGTLYTTGDYGYIACITDNGNTYTNNYGFQAAAIGYSSPCSIGINNRIYYGGAHDSIIAI